MANETTSTTYDSASLAYTLGDRALKANLPKWVLLGLVNEIDNEGEGSDTVQLAVESDLGVASAGTEGTEYTTNEALGFGTAIQFVIAEAAAIQRAVVTNFAVEKKFPGMGGVHALLQNASLEQKLSILGPEAERIAAPCMEKREDDVANLLGGFSNTVGTSGADLTIANLIAAQYTLKSVEPLHEDWCYVLTPNQVQEMQLELGVTGGGLGGSVWASQADASFFNFRPDAPRNGFRGTFMNIPIYEYSHSLRTTANAGADVCGALMCRGVGDPRKGGQLGGIAIATSGFLKFHLQYEAGYRGVVMVCTSDHVAGEIRDTHGVSIITDAP